MTEIPHTKLSLRERKIKLLKAYYRYRCFHLETTMKLSVLSFKRSPVVPQIKDW